MQKQSKTHLSIIFLMIFILIFSSSFILPQIFASEECSGESCQKVRPHKYRSRDIIFARRAKRAQMAAEKAQAQQEKIDKVKEEIALMITNLNKEGIVRFFFAASAGKGHYASTYNLMKRLVELGYRGKFDLILDERENGQYAFSKIRSLLPQIKGTTLSMDFNDPNAVFQFMGQPAILRVLERTFTKPTEEDPLNEQKEDTRQVAPFSILNDAREKVKYAFSGGLDEERDIHAHELSADYFVVTQPLGWNLGNHRIETPAGVFDLNQKTTDRDFRFVPAYREPAQRPEEKTLNPQEKTLLEVTDLAKGDQINMASLYGIDTKTNPFDFLANYVLTIMKAQAERKKLPPSTPPMQLILDEERVQKSLMRKNVLIVLGEMPTLKAQDTKTYRGNSGDIASIFLNYMTQGQAYPNFKFPKAIQGIQTLCEKYRCNERVRVKNIGPDNRDEILLEIEKMKAGDFLILFITSVDPQLFEYTMANGRNLPNIFEGQSTLELSLTLGRPFFQIGTTGDAYHFFKAKIDDKSEIAYTQVCRFNSGLSFGHDTFGMSFFKQDYEDHLIKPAQVFSKLFQMEFFKERKGPYQLLKETSTDPTNTKVESLLRLLLNLEKHGQLKAP